MSHPLPHAVTRLNLQQFRNYAALTLDVPPAPVVLRGANGAGKTNILEAISLLSPGRGLRGAKLSEMQRAGARGQGGLESADRRAPLTVYAELSLRGETHRIGTGRDPESAIEKRLLHINGERARAQTALTHYACVQWLTPALDTLWVAGGSARRSFFDRIVYGFAPEHASRVSAYERAMRERNRLLLDRASADPYWLSVLEQQMAEHAVAITHARLETLLRLSKALDAPEAACFPRATLALEGQLEQWLAEGLSALEVEERAARALASARAVDAARGRASLGPQRSQWVVIHAGKDMLAEHCSTGEQKAVLLAITLAAARARADWCGVPPILLLDEVIAHLDEARRRSLFELIGAMRIQAWMTGTDAADFAAIAGDATVLEVAAGVVVGEYAGRVEPQP